MRKPSQRLNLRLHWLTNKSACQSVLEAKRQVCSQVEGSVGIWVSQCLNSAAVVTACPGRACCTNIKGQLAITLLLITFIFHAALKSVLLPPQEKKLNISFLQHLLWPQSTYSKDSWAPWCHLWQCSLAAPSKPLPQSAPAKVNINKWWADFIR